MSIFILSLRRTEYRGNSVTVRKVEAPCTFTCCASLPWQFILKSITLAQLVVVKELLRMMLLWHAILTKGGVSPLRSDPLYIQACYK